MKEEGWAGGGIERMIIFAFVFFLFFEFKKFVVCLFNGAFFLLGVTFRQFCDERFLILIGSCIFNSR